MKRKFLTFSLTLLALISWTSTSYGDDQCKIMCRSLYEECKVMGGNDCEQKYDDCKTSCDHSGFQRVTCESLYQTCQLLGEEDCFENYNKCLAGR